MDEKAEAVKGGVAIPGLLSYLVYQDTSKPVQGLRDFKPEDRPPVNLSFQFYHIMVAVGFGMIVVAGLGFLYFWRGSLFEKRWLLWLLVLSVLGPQIANQAGWFAAEVGRQPWIVYGLLRTLGRAVGGGQGRRGADGDCPVQRGLPAAVRGLRLPAERQDPARAGRGGPDAEREAGECRKGSA